MKRITLTDSDNAALTSLSAPKFGCLIFHSASFRRGTRCQNLRPISHLWQTERAGQEALAPSDSPNVFIPPANEVQLIRKMQSPKSLQRDYACPIESRPVVTGETGTDAALGVVTSGISGARLYDIISYLKRQAWTFCTSQFSLSLFVSSSFRTFAVNFLPRFNDPDRSSIFISQSFMLLVKYGAMITSPRDGSF